MMPLQSFTDCALINKKMLGYTEDDYKVQIPRLFRCWQKIWQVIKVHEDCSNEVIFDDN